VLLKKKIESKDNLIKYFLSGCKNFSNRKIGTEHENFLFNKINKKAIPYKGKVKKTVIEIFSQLKKLGWKEIIEGKNIIGLTKKKKILLLSQVFN